jgi:hypothetical protein
MALLLVFLFLDVWTTLAGLRLGLGEINPLVASAVRHDGIKGFLTLKVMAMTLAGYFLHTGRLALLQRATVLVGVVVLWNLFWLAVS